MMTGNQIREAFLRFFEQRGHTVLPSSSLVPEDPTTLFTTAGMQQFVPWFRREVEPPYGSVVTVQKCLRTDDLDNVGRMGRYHTFFEMLGNFSFGDYFKKETLQWGWEFATTPQDAGGLGFDPERIWVTYYKPKAGEPYQEDVEAQQIWLAIGVPAERVIPLGKKENWWGPVGDSGPCGPCSEMHYDLGAHLACGPECQSPECGCDRWLEFWNHVFQQFNFQDGEYRPLPVPGIDTGAGLERIVSIVQNVASNYETDLLAAVMDETCRLTGVQRDTPERDLAAKVIADHLRCAVFAISDGVLPSNIKRGYVIRRIIRRAYRYGRALGFTEPFLYKLVPTLVGIMGGHYHAVADNERFITYTLQAEEARFAETLERGEELLKRLVAQAEQSKQIRDSLQAISHFNDTKQAFSNLAQSLSTFRESQLKESFKQINESLNDQGLLHAQMMMTNLGNLLQARFKSPQDAIKELTEAIEKAFIPTQQALQELSDSMSKIQIQLKGEDVFTLYDTYGFPRELTEETAQEVGIGIDEQGYQAAFQAARERARAGGKFAYEASGLLSSEIPETEFLGYRVTEVETTLLHFEANDERTAGMVVLDKSPFYATSGGQCADYGTLVFDGTTLAVTDVSRDKFGHILHTVDLIGHEEFTPGPNHSVTARVDIGRRDAIRRAHTSTHLLHWALQQVLGEHAKQAGSQVDEDVLRFDFNHPQALTADELTRIEELVYGRVLLDAPVVIRDMTLPEARAAGYTALFGEKYGEQVRTVNIGGDEMSLPFSRELCGGTHLDRTGQVGYMKILVETSVAAGIRRIEAVTGLKAADWARGQAMLVRELAATLKATPDEVPARVEALQRDLREAQQQINELKVKVAAGGGGTGPQAEEINGVPVIIAQLEGVDAATLAALADQYLHTLQGGVVALAAATDGKALFAVKVSKVHTGTIHAGNLVKAMATVAGGGGGGRPDFAQAGGKDATKIPDALAKAREMIGG